MEIMYSEYTSFVHCTCFHWVKWAVFHVNALPPLQLSSSVRQYSILWPSHHDTPKMSTSNSILYEYFCTFRIFVQTLISGGHTQKKKWKGKSLFLLQSHCLLQQKSNKHILISHRNHWWVGQHLSTHVRGGQFR